MTQRPRLLLAALALVAMSAAPAHAQEVRVQGGGAERVTVVAAGVPLAEALEALVDRTRIALVYEDRLVAGRTATCRAERVPHERALACVLDGTGLDYARLSSGTYTLFEAARAASRWGGLAGRVVDAETGAPLAGAHVVLATADRGEPAGAASNAAGRFALPRLLPGPRRLVVTHVGYRPAEVRVYVEEDQTERVAVALRPDPALSAPVVVSGLEWRALSERLGRGRVALAPVAPAPVVEERGEPVSVDLAVPPTPDATRALDAVVGVRAGGALADVHVQGGGAGDHALRLDGAPVLAPVAVGGLVGPFSPFALSRVVVHKAGYGAGLGSGISGVVDAESVVAPPEGEALTVQADALALNARWGGRRGRAAATEAAWSLAARTALWDALPPPALAPRLRSWAAPDSFLVRQLGQEPIAPPPDGFPVHVGFTDLHAAGRVGVGGLRSLRGSVYLGRHGFGVEDTGADDTPADELYEDAYRWTNATGGLRYEWVEGARAFARVGAWASGYRLDRPAVLGGGASNSVRMGGLRAGLDLAAAPRHAVSAEAEVTRIGGGAALNLPGAPAGTDPVDRDPIGWTVAGSVEDRVDVGARTSVTVGARLTWLPERQALYAEPRAALRYDAPGGPLGPWALRVAAGRYLQFVTALDVDGGGAAPLLPRVRYWLPLGAAERPPEAYHLAAEAVAQPAGAWEVGVEVYAKHQPHLLVAGYGTGAPLAPADGGAAGLALRADWATDALRVGAAYEGSLARQRVPGRFDGAWTPTPWDAPHRLRLAVDARPAARVVLTARGEAVFGRTWGFRQAYYDLLAPDPATRRFGPFSLDDPGSHRLPAHVQLDVGAAYTADVAGARLQARVGLVNALGRANVRDWLLDADEGGYVRRPRLALPRFPVLSVRLTP